MSHPRLAVFARQANGQVAPLRIIEGTNTNLSRSSHGIALDPVHNEVIMPSAMAGAIVVHRRDADGDATPLRTIIGSLTKLRSPQGVAVDLVHDEIVVSNDSRESIVVFSRTANGNVAPLREIRGAATGINNTQGIIVDPVNGEIILAIEGDDEAVPPIPPALLVFSRTASGNVAPIRKIEGPTTQLLRPRQLQHDTDRDEIVLADRGLTQEFIFDTPGGILIWDRTASGDAPPKRILRGPVSQLTGPRSVYVDMVNDEIGAGDTTSHAIFVYPRDF